MPASPRLLAIMGSGETSPTMTSVHADLFARVGGGDAVPAVMLDTPFGFQENAAEIAAKALTYFRENVQREVTVASYRGAPWAADGDYETMLARVRAAAYVFSGPGSPSYALRQWAGSALPSLLAEKLRGGGGGCLVFASAAAATLGVLALPVYEIYKVGADPHWLDGLDLLASIGINAAVVPHYNNAEGGTHDTSHCYMGERRLRLLEEMMPADAYVLGVDEHTALTLDLDADVATVRGNGGVTLRHRGGERRIESGASVALDVLRTATSARAGGSAVASPVAAAAGGPVAASTNPFADGVAERRDRFDAAIATGDVPAAQSALLDLDAYLWEWSRESFATDDMDQARALMRSMLVRLADLARLGARDPRTLVAPFVEAILDLRRTARADRRFADADALRDSLLALGVEIKDTPTGTDWELPARFGA